MRGHEAIGLGLRMLGGHEAIGLGLGMLGGHEAIRLRLEGVCLTYIHIPEFHDNELETEEHLFIILPHGATVVRLSWREEGPKSEYANRDGSLSLSLFLTS